MSVDQDPALRGVDPRQITSASSEIPPTGSNGPFDKNPLESKLRNLMNRRISRRQAVKGGLVVAGVAAGVALGLRTALISAETPIQSFTWVDSLARNRNWEIKHGTPAMFPPNDPGRQVDTVLDTIDGASPVRFQADGTKYTETKISLGISIAIAGVAAEPETNLGFLVTAITIPIPSNPHSRRVAIEEFDNINPTDYTKHVVFDLRLPQEGSNGLGDGVGSVALGSDEQGRYIDIGIQNSKYSPNDGVWRVRRNQEGHLIGPAVQISVANPPAPEPTPTPYRIYLPFAAAGLLKRFFNWRGSRIAVNKRSK